MATTDSEGKPLRHICGRPSVLHLLIEYVLGISKTAPMGAFPDAWATFGGGGTSGKLSLSLSMYRQGVARYKHRIDVYISQLNLLTLLLYHV